MIKIFTLNKAGKIELTKDELQKLLDDSYWEGYRNGNNTIYTYHSPSVTTPWTVTCNTATNTATVNASDLSSATTVTTDNFNKDVLKVSL